MIGALATAAGAILAAAVWVAPPFRAYGYKPLDTPRTVWVCIGAAVVFVAALVSGTQMPTGPAFAPALGLWLVAGVLCGPRSAVHAERLVFWASAWLLGAMWAPAAGLMAPRMIAVSAAAAAGLHVWQMVCRDKRLWDGLASVAGNTNLLGTFLVPCVFFAMAAGLWPLAALMVASLLLTRCRSALIGLIAGVAVAPAAIGPVAIGAAAYIGVTWWRNRRNPAAPEKARYWVEASSLHSRIGIWRCALAQIRQHLVFGIGLDGLKLFVARRRVEAGNPVVVFRKAHNDALQLTVDAGLIGLALVAALVGAAAGSGLAAGNTWMLAALAGQLASGLFLHTLYLPLGTITFAVICGQLCVGMPAGGMEAVAVDAVLAAAAVMIVWRHMVKRLAAYWWFGRYVIGTTDERGQRVTEVRLLKSALALLPDDSTLRFHAAEAAALTGRPLSCQQHFWHALATHDGECRPEVILTRMGHHLMRCHQIETAACALRQALFLSPGYGAAQTEIDALKSGFTPQRQAALPPAVLARTWKYLEGDDGKGAGGVGKGAVCPVAGKSKCRRGGVGRRVDPKPSAA